MVSTSSSLLRGVLRSATIRCLAGAGALLACSVQPVGAQYADWNATPPKILPNERQGSGAVYETGSGRQFPNTDAFAVLKSDGSVVTWGVAASGGDSSAVAARLSSNVTAVYSTGAAFAALKNDGSVVTWGKSSYGGDSSAVAARLSSNVTAVYSTGGAFAALKSDGSVVTWGDFSYGGDSTAVAASLSSNVKAVYSNPYAFAALKNDGSVVTWGDYSYGGYSTAVAGSLTSNVTVVFSNANAFAALKSDGSVVIWGAHFAGGASGSGVADRLSSNVTAVYSTGSAFAALKSDGSVVTWGADSGGNSSAVAARLSSNVTAVYSTGAAFAALKNDGSVVTWGVGASGGDSSAVAARLSSNVTAVYSTGSAFAALKSDGSVVTWGQSSYGGDSSAVTASLTANVKAVYSTALAFAALKSDGSVVTWGADSGGNSSAVAASLTANVKAVYSTVFAFVALKNDGSVVTWGDGAKGGDSSAVAARLSSGVKAVQSVSYFQYGPSISAATGNITSTTANLLGEVTSEGNSPVTARGFVYALASVTDPKIGDAGVTQVADSGSGLGSYSQLLSGLTPNTAYVFRSYVVNDEGTTYSSAENFSTNLPPVIISDGGNTNVSFSVAENSTAVSVVNATDADPGQTITYSLSGADAARFAIGSTSGVLTFASAPDYEAPADANADNVYTVVVAATDNGNPPKSAKQTLTVTVTNAADNGILAVEQPAGTSLANSGTANFGSITIGQTNELTFTLRSQGEVSLLMQSGAVISGAAASEYSLIGSVPTSLATDGSATFTVRFSPATSGNRLATLSIPTNDTRPGRSPYTITLSGIGSATPLIATYSNAASQVLGGWVNGGNFTIGSVGATNPGNNWPSAESPDKVVDANSSSKFLTFRNSNAGVILKPTNSNLAFNRLSLWTANDASERDPASYIIYGSSSDLTGSAGTNIPISSLTEIASGNVTMQSARSAGPTVIQLANNVAYTSYVVAFPTVRNPTGNNLTQISEIQLSQGTNPPLAVAMADARGGQLSGGNFTFGSTGRTSPGTNWDASETPDHAMDGNVNTKFMIFRSTGAGLIASPQAGAARMNTLTLWTANDSPERDPASYEVYGFPTRITQTSGTLAVSGGTLLGSGTMTLPSTRNSGPVQVTFNNSTAYASYLVVFPTVKNSPSTNMTQVSELQFSYNGLPDFALSATTITVAEDSASYSRSEFATSLIPGIGDVGQTVTLSCTNDNNALFSTQPAISADGTLTFTPAANAYGTAVVSVIATDSTGLSNTKTFSIEITSVFDAPVLAAPTVSNISAYSASFLGEVTQNTDNLDFVSLGFIYAPASAGSTLEFDGAGAVTVPGFAVSATMVLSSGTSYRIRSYCYTPATGMVYSEVTNFTTLQGNAVMLDNTDELSKPLVNPASLTISDNQRFGYKFTTGSKPVDLSTVTVGLSSSGDCAIRIQLYECGTDGLPVGEALLVHQEPSRNFGAAGVYATFRLSGWQLDANHSYSVKIDTTSGSAVWWMSSPIEMTSSAGWNSDAVWVSHWRDGNLVLDYAYYPFAIQMTGTLEETPTHTHQELWRFANFGSYDSVDSGADAADPDGDGLNNLMEYALGTAPNGSGVIPAVLALNGVNLEYTYTRSTAAKDNGVTYQVEWSETLEAGSWSTETVTQQITSTQGALETVKASIPKGTTGKRFLRLRVGAPVGGQ